MRCNSRYVNGLSIVVLLGGLSLTSIASAQTTPKVVASQPANSQLVGTLKSAHMLLAQANRDYDGHRAAAAQEVRKAMKDLGYQHNHKKGQTGSTPVAGATTAVKKAAHAQQQAAVHEPQANSDAQLRKAQQILQGAVTQLGASHPKAAANLKTAIAEIDKALAVR
jgi:hypothetical protein